MLKQNPTRWSTARSPTPCSGSTSTARPSTTLEELLEKYPDEKNARTAGRLSPTSAAWRTRIEAALEAVREALEARSERRRGPASLGRPAEPDRQGRRSDRGRPGRAQGRPGQPRLQPHPRLRPDPVRPHRRGDRPLQGPARTLSQQRRDRPAGPVGPLGDLRQPERVRQGRGRAGGAPAARSRRGRGEQRPRLPLCRPGEEPREGRGDDPQGRPGGTRQRPPTSTASAGSCSSAASSRRRSTRWRRRSRTSPTGATRRSTSTWATSTSSSRRPQKAKAAWEQAEKAAVKAVPPDKRLPEIRKKLQSLEKLGSTPKPATGDTP